MEHQIREQQLPCARLCHIIKWDDFDGYGFNLHAEKGRQGQFIGKVDEGSPSEAAGLRKGDRIIEVNDVNITGETHKQVVERIKSLAGETRLLVVDQLADEYFKTNNMPIKGSMPGIRKLRTPDKSPHQLLQEERDAALAAAAAAATAAANNAAPNKHRNGHQNSSMNSDSLSNDSSDHHQQQHHSIHDEYGNGTSRMIHDEDATSVKSSVSGNSKHEQQSATTTMSSPSQLDLSVTDSPNSGAGQGTTMTPSATTLNLAMSAKELRAKLAQRKKYDPRKESLNFKDKFDIVQKL